MLSRQTTLSKFNKIFKFAFRHQDLLQSPFLLSFLSSNSRNLPVYLQVRATAFPLQAAVGAKPNCNMQMWRCLGFWMCEKSVRIFFVQEICLCLEIKPAKEKMARMRQGRAKTIHQPLSWINSYLDNYPGLLHMDNFFTALQDNYPGWKIAWTMFRLLHSMIILDQQLLG